MTTWLLWAVLLLLQNAAFTWVSRARNSKSIGYHAFAAVFSNGIYILNQFIVVNKLVEARKSGSLVELTIVCLFYTLFTVTGGVTMHSFLMKHVERGRREIGSK